MYQIKLIGILYYLPTLRLYVYTYLRKYVITFITLLVKQNEYIVNIMKDMFLILICTTITK